MNVSSLNLTFQFPLQCFMMKKESSGGPSQIDCSGRFLNDVLLYKIICLKDWELRGKFYPLFSLVNCVAQQFYCLIKIQLQGVKKNGKHLIFMIIRFVLQYIYRI